MTLRALLRRLKPQRTADSKELAEFGPEQEAHVLARAYVPEHIPSLMQGISDAPPLLIDDHLAFAGENWLIFVGYPLDGHFTVSRCEQAVAQARAACRPETLWFIGPEIPPGLAAICQDRESDVYYQLGLPAIVKSAPRRAVRSAAAVLSVNVGHAFTHEHQALTDELMERQSLARQPLPPIVEALYRAMPAYLAHTPSASVLEARSTSGALAAFYVVEAAAPAFDTYVLGAYSRRIYVPYASDLLFAAMIQRAEARGKSALNLGLGVNDGIRRFKEKWGGVPYLAYEACECRFSGPLVTDLLSELKL